MERKVESLVAADHLREGFFVDQNVLHQHKAVVEEIIDNVDFDVFLLKHGDTLNFLPSNCSKKEIFRKLKDTGEKYGSHLCYMALRLSADEDVKKVVKLLAEEAKRREESKRSHQPHSTSAHVYPLLREGIEVLSLTEVRPSELVAPFEQHKEKNSSHLDTHSKSVSLPTTSHKWSESSEKNPKDNAEYQSGPLQTTGHFNDSIYRVHLLLCHCCKCTSDGSDDVNGSPKVEHSYYTSSVISGDSVKSSEMSFIYEESIDETVD